LKPLNLSEVEIAVLYMIVRGCPAAEVRQRLDLSDEQIRVHMSTIYKAFALSGKTELLSLADSCRGEIRCPETPVRDDGQVLPE